MERRLTAINQRDIRQRLPISITEQRIQKTYIKAGSRNCVNPAIAPKILFWLSHAPLSSSSD